MTYQNVSIVLSPTMQISHRVLNVLFLNHANLFSSVVIKRLVNMFLLSDDRTVVRHDLKAYFLVFSTGEVVVVGVVVIG